MATFKTSKAFFLTSVGHIVLPLLMTVPCVANSEGQSQPTKLCETIFQGDTKGHSTALLSQIESFRIELLDSFGKYVQSLKDTKRIGRFEQKIGSESKSIDLRVIGAAHVINVAGASTIRRMLYDFPFAKAYHTIDVIQSWHGTYYNVIFEYLRALEHVGDHAEVKIISQGFLDLYKATIGLSKPIGPSKEMEERFFKLMRADPLNRKPLIVQVTWDSKVFGRIEKLFYFHPATMESYEELEEVLAYVRPEENLGGILMEGIGHAKDKPALEYWLTPLFERLQIGGFYITPMYEYMDASPASRHTFGDVGEYFQIIKAVGPTFDLQKFSFSEDLTSHDDRDTLLFTKVKNKSVLVAP